MSKLGNGWRKSEEYQAPRQAEYHKQMADEQRLQVNFKRPATTDQTENYYASIERETRGEKRNWIEPLPDNVLAVPEAKSIDQLVGTRFFDTDQIYHAQSVRGSQKNSLGESKESGASDRRKDFAAHVFNVTPPADMSKEDPDRLVGLVEIASKPVEWVPVPIHTAIWKKLTGHLVRWRGK